MLPLFPSMRLGASPLLLLLSALCSLLCVGSSLELPPSLLHQPYIPSSLMFNPPSTSPAIAAAQLAAVDEEGAVHHFTPYQASTFSMVRLCASAPWSPRIQPALLPMHVPITYTSVLSNLSVSTSSPWLLLYEGGLLYPPNNLVENDVWASTDDGETWDLIAGISRFGRNGTTLSASPYTSFSPRVGATNCEDPSTDDVYSLSGVPAGGASLGVNDVWFSDHGVEWYKTATSFLPGRFYASCDVNSQSHLLMMGGAQATSTSTLLLYNDVWIAEQNSWKLQCARAPWAARGEHLVLVGSNGLLDRELVYVIGGHIAIGSQDQGLSRQANDVWVSSDEGASWGLVTAFAPWSTRWGHVGAITSGGVLLVIGGTHNDYLSPNQYNQNDVWSSFDGGVSWTRCNLPVGAAFVRGEMGLALNDYEELILASGYAYAGPAGRPSFNDVWRSTFSLQDPETLLPICNARIPVLGVGLSTWPKTVTPASTAAAPRPSSSSTSTPLIARVSSATSAVRQGSSSSSSPASALPQRPSSSSSTAGAAASAAASSGGGGALPVRVSSSSTGSGPALSSLSFTRLTAAALWSQRKELSLVSMRRAVSFTSTDKAIVTLTPPWLALFGGEPGPVGAAMLENDVWASSNAGLTWQLLAGVSTYGRLGPTLSGSPNSSFTARQSARGCAHPTTGRVYSLGGFTAAGVAVNEVWVSDDAVSWSPLPSNSSTPLFTGRGGHTCGFNDGGQLILTGGRGFNRLGAPGVELNDVWRMSSAQQWEQMTEVAPWKGREQHLTLYGRAPLLGVSVLYVLGGGELGPSTAYAAFNDVWASSDDGRSWALVTSAAPWGPRWGATGALTSGGVLLVMGGAHADDGDAVDQAYTQRDAWASFDGGVSWARCSLPSPVSAREFVRVEQGSLVDSEERLWLLAGNAVYPQLVTSFNDVWRSDVSLSDTATLARLCGGGGLPAVGVGLQAWPAVPAAPTEFSVTPRTLTPPWSARIQPALLPMYSPITYTRVPDGASVTTTSPWWLLYEGSLARIDGPDYNENDVWASTDEGATWDLISGVSYFGDGGVVASALPNSSFSAVAGSTNCEDPSSDTIFSLGGLDIGSRQVSSTVWTSDDGLHWSKMPEPTFSPGRYFSSCDVTRQQHLLTMGGYSLNALLNDVWSWSGGAWKRITAQAPWAARGEHLVVIGEADALRVELIYVMGGTVRNDAAQEQSNDVWASSDEGASWVQITANAAWGPRWGHVGAITAAGVLLVLGGLNNEDPTQPNRQTTYKDMWASFDGGYSWGKCDVRDGDTNAFIRGEQALALTDAEELLLGTGYLWDGEARQEFNDLWKSTFSLSNYDALAVMCHSTIPQRGIGLTSWPSSTPPPSPPPTSHSSSTAASEPAMEPKSGSGGLSGAAVFGIILAVLLVVLGVSGTGYYFYRKRLASGRPYDLRGGGALDSGFGPRSGGFGGFGRGGGGGFGENASASSLLSQGDGSEFYMEMSTDNKPRISGERQWQS